MKKALLSFADGLLSREQMKVVRGGDGELGEGGSSAGCPTAGTRYFYSDSSGCGYWEVGFNAIGAQSCTGTVHYTAQQPCGWA